MLMDPAIYPGEHTGYKTKLLYTSKQEYNQFSFIGFT